MSMMQWRIDEGPITQRPHFCRGTVRAGRRRRTISKSVAYHTTRKHKVYKLTSRWFVLHYVQTSRPQRRLSDFWLLAWLRRCCLALSGWFVGIPTTLLHPWMPLPGGIHFEASRTEIKSQKKIKNNKKKKKKLLSNHFSLLPQTFRVALLGVNSIV